jgi:hypothetical protein
MSTFYIGIGSANEIVREKQVATLRGDQNTLIVSVAEWDRPALAIDKVHENLNVTLLWWEFRFLLLPILPYHRRQWAQETVWRFLAGGTGYEKALDMNDWDVRWPPEGATLQRAYHRIRFLWSYQFRN